jgi:hypothetical protein
MMLYQEFEKVLGEDGGADLGAHVKCRVVKPFVSRRDPMPMLFEGHTRN